MNHLLSSPSPFRHRVVPTLALLAPLATAAAVETPFVGPRGTAMGGANVASVDSASAQFYNPAAFGFMNAAEDAEGNDNAEIGDRFLGISLFDLQAGYRLTGDLGQRLEILAGTDIDGIGTETTFTEEQATELLETGSQLIGIDDPGNTIQFDANAGSHVRIGNLAVGARVFGSVGAFVAELDTFNLGLNSSDVNDQLDEARGGTTPSGSTLSADQRSQLSSAGVSAANIDYLDHLATEEIAAGTFSEREFDDSFEILLGVVDATGDPARTIDGNTTAVVARGLGVAEIPVSYGYAVTENLAIGATAKLMFGRVYGTTILIFDEDNDAVIDEATDEYEETVTVGLDLALLYRLPTLNLGLSARNLNQPEFDGFTTTSGVEIDDVEIDPQVTLGAAWYPLPTLVVEGNLELLEQEALVGDYDTQFLSAGVEWDVLRILALRAGGYTNLADSDIGPIVSVGVGINLYLARIDVAAASSLDTAEFDGEEVPEEARVSLGVAVEF